MKEISKNNKWSKLLLLILITQIIIPNSICQRPEKKLKFNENHEFTILQITDLHYGENSTGDYNSTQLQIKLINEVKPDMVVVSGDSASGYSYEGEKDWYKNLWKNWTEAYTATNTVYAYTFGNHDDQGDLSREEIYKLDKTNPLSLMKRSHNISGLSNYNLPIYSAFNSSIVTSMLWMLDSGDEGCLNHNKTWGCIEPDQVAWYKNKSEKMTKKFGRNIPGLGFFHIPLVEYRYLFDYRLTYGYKNEPVNCPNYQTDIFSEIKNQGNIKATFCGHDHNNDYGGHYNEVELVYGRKTGYGGYGPNYFQRGARVIKLKEKMGKEGLPEMSYSHYVIQEDLTTTNPWSWWQGWRNQGVCSKDGWFGNNGNRFKKGLEFLQ